ncbi:MAG: flavodoxin family protein [Clostridium sp.]|nr:flavodoxin family protein [Clostridium sp.]
MNVLAINCSPRKNWNTAQLLKSALEGAKSNGAEVEYINLYDLNFAGCRSCMLCKRKDVERCHCYWKDDLSPVIDKIFAADVLFIGTPIYLGRPTSQYFALMERLHFTALSYDDYRNYFNGKVNVGMFVTMNATEEFYDKLYKEKFEEYASEFKALNGDVSIYPCYNTLQVKDYSKFNMSSFSEEDKKKVHEDRFLIDLKNVYDLGVKLAYKA